MRISNETAWTTRHLRAITKAVADMVLTPSERAKARIMFRRARGAWASGQAWHRTAMVRVPPAGRMTEDGKLDLIVVLAHEMMHLFGGPQGRDAEIAMRKSIPFGRPKAVLDKEQQRALYQHILDLPLEPAPLEQSRPIVAIEQRLRRTERMIRAWRTRIKRGTTLMRKYERRAKALSKRAAAMRTKGGGR